MNKALLAPVAILIVVGCQGSDKSASDSTSSGPKADSSTTGGANGAANSANAGDIKGKWLISNGSSTGQAELKADGTFTERALAKEGSGLLTLDVSGTYKMEGSDKMVLHMTKVVATGTDEATKQAADEANAAPKSDLTNTLQWVDKDDMNVSGVSNNRPTGTSQWKRQP